MAKHDELPHTVPVARAHSTGRSRSVIRSGDVMNRPILIAAVLATLAACATSYEPGWQASAATPFDTARRYCEAQAVRQMTEMTRDVAFDSCMAGQGWHRH